jgi:hypothetical protein
MFKWVIGFIELPLKSNIGDFIMLKNFFKLFTFVFLSLHLSCFADCHPKRIENSEATIQEGEIYYSVTLEDGSCWEIAPEDNEKYSQWDDHEVVCISVNQKKASLNKMGGKERVRATLLSYPPSGLFISQAKMVKTGEIGGGYKKPLSSGGWKWIQENKPVYTYQITVSDETGIKGVYASKKYASEYAVGEQVYYVYQYPKDPVLIVGTGHEASYLQVTDFYGW